MQQDVIESQSDHVFVTPTAEVLAKGRASIISRLPTTGYGSEATLSHLTEDLRPAFSGSSISSRYYGFVTGGAMPAARMADHLAVDADQNVQVHLPNETIATDVEDAALRMLCELLKFEPSDWPHRTFTTGATASNVAGLACGRQSVLMSRVSNADVAEHGIVEAMRMAKIDTFQVLATVPHSSLKKAASIVGLGRASVISVALGRSAHLFDFEKLETLLQTPRAASIVAVSCSEVNTGLFASQARDMIRLRELCDKYLAWLHVDAAFGALARVLPDDPQYASIRDGVAGLEMCDSLTGDAHKLLNVPYDCGFFLSKHLNNAVAVFQNVNAAYLSSTSSVTIPSPLNIGLENSRRFRALPVYANLVAYGTAGYRDMLERQIALARLITIGLHNSREYEVLPRGDLETQIKNTFVVVLFRARSETLNQSLVQKINATRRIYVSGTSWDDRPAARFAIANWQVDPETDIKVIAEVLDQVAAER